MTGQLPIIPPDREDDLRGLQFLDDPDLIVFMAGNQFMVMPELIEAFQSENPDIKKIFYETLPPGLELNQILAGGAIFRDIKLPGNPDVYTSVTEE
ncbi:MAG: molybdenum ABC transporter substrate-binding protein, partial [Nitrospirae bacterium]